MSVNQLAAEGGVGVVVVVRGGGGAHRSAHADELRQREG